ncbi:MAG: heavy metal translocating P-type ATPase metal-binding domain-containing protein [Bacteroidota bacterium]
MEKQAIIKQHLEFSREDCYHCGEACPSMEVVLGDKCFCCEGCKTVYEILHAHDLCTYYELAEQPGVQLTLPSSLEKYSYLDHPEIQDQLADFVSEQEVRLRLHIPQIHCASCIWLLENLYKLRPGINFSRVQFLRKELSVSYEPSLIQLKELVGLLASIGYEPAINLGTHSSTPRHNKELLYRLGLAGFCAGNIMLLSFPEYLGLTAFEEGEFSQFFPRLNLLFGLPVLLYSAYPFFRSAFQGLQHKKLNIDVPIVLGILALFGRSAYEIMSQTGAGYMDSLAGLVFLLLVGRWFQQRTYDSISFDRDYKSFFPLGANILKKGEVESVPFHTLKKGQTLVIPHEGIIAGDGILLSDAAHIDYSFVNGEAAPVKVEKGEKVFAGGKQLGTSIQVLLRKEPSQSYLTQLWNHESFKENSAVSIGELANHYGQYFTLAIIAISLLAGILWLWIDPAKAAHVFTSVLIVACPCALALASPIILGNAMRIMSMSGMYVKDTGVIEALTKLDHIIFDKTGTITYAHLQHISWEGEPLTTKNISLIYSLVHHSTHPVSTSIKSYLEGQPTEIFQVESFQAEKGRGLSANIQHSHVRIGKANFVNVNQLYKPSQTHAFVSIDHEVIGCFILGNTYRKGLKKMIGELENYSLALISGDHQGERTNLRTLFGEGVPLLFQQSPEDKRAFIQHLQQQGHHVMMIGDGLNDAGALKVSQVGMAISDNNLHFSPACDIILEGKTFSQLPDWLQFAKTSISLVKAAFIISIGYNIIGLSIAVQGHLSPLIAAILMPISSLSIVGFGLLTTTLSSPKKGAE